MEKYSRYGITALLTIKNAIFYISGLRVRTAMTSAIYRKSLKLSNKAKREMTGIHTQRLPGYLT